MLSSIRVLDLTDEKGFTCGKILGDIGADVIKIERPEGDLARIKGPFWHDIAAPENSLYWIANNVNKKGITLNIETAEGQKIFKKMLESSDIVIESFAPDYLDELDLGYQRCSEINPNIIMTSITPYGQNGPYKNFKAYDLQAQVMGGTVYICGYPNEPPVYWGGQQAYFQAGLQAAVGTIIALWHREIAGEGQHVDVSIREAMLVLTTTEAPVANWVEAQVIKQRKGDRQEDLGGRTLRWFYPCKDGYIIWRLTVGVMGHMNNSLVEWMEEEGMADGLMQEIPDWRQFGLAELRQDDISRWENIFARFFLTKSKQELFEAAANRGIILYPLSCMAEVLENSQLTSRNYWAGLKHPVLGNNIKYPGALFKATETPCEFKHSAPLLGEHNDEIYQNELGFSSKHIKMLKNNHVI